MPKSSESDPESSSPSSEEFLPGPSVPWARIVGALRRHPVAADSAFAVCLCAIAVTGLFAVEGNGVRSATAPNAFAVVLTVVMTLPLALRRRAPLAVLGVTIGALIPYVILNFPDVAGTFGPLVAMYSVGSHCERRRSFTVFVVVAIVMAPVMIAGTLVESVKLPWPAVVGNYVVYFTAWVLGDSLRNRRAYLRELELRADAAEQRREDDARRAVEAERDRIACELHDVVAHSMAVMVVQAGAARRVLHAQPDRADEALRQVESTGRDAMVEMRRMVGVLRDGDRDGADDSSGANGASRAPQPGLESLPTLIDQLQQAGLPIELEVAGDRRPLQAGVDLSAYRIVQEALTNTFKHAGPAHAKVRVAYGSDELELTVTDDGRGLAATSANGRPGSGETADAGHGLVGMRERVSLIGGDLRVGPRSGGGFEVAARLPLDA